LEFLGATLDEEANRSMQLDRDHPIAVFSRARARTSLIAVATNEEAIIARETAEAIEENNELQPDATVPVAISARHVHLSRASLDKLFGIGYQLTVDHDLSQPGQFAAVESVTLLGPRSTIEHVRILGPLRDQDQVEVSRSDEFTLGVDAPVRASGDLAHTPGITLVGPKAQVILENGLICAWRHIHMAPSDALRWGVKDGDVVSISTKAKHRTLEFQEVLIRVNASYRLEMHIDTDEANAAGLESNATGVLRPTHEPTLVHAARRPSLYEVGQIRELIGLPAQAVVHSEQGLLVNEFASLVRI
jgi:acetate kinase